MRWRTLERVLWLVVAVAAMWASAGWRRAVPRVIAPAASMSTAPHGLPWPPADSLAVAAERVFERDPFRLSRRPSATPYRPDQDGVPPPLASRPPRPQLAVSGFVGGPPWRAMLEGVPGRDGSVLVQTGDTVAQLRITRVRRDTVVVQGLDTTWTLTLRRQWR